MKGGKKGRFTTAGQHPSLPPSLSPLEGKGGEKEKEKKKRNGSFPDQYACRTLPPSLPPFLPPSSILFVLLTRI